MFEFLISWIITLIAIRFFILQNKFKSIPIDANMSNSTKDIISIILSLVLTVLITLIQLFLDFVVVDSISKFIIKSIK